MPHDVVTFGEARVRLTPPNHRRIEQAYSFDVEIGGAELNTAVGLVRLGRSAAWVSRLTDNPLGRLVANRAREAGVGVDHVAWTSEDRVGLYFLEEGAAPRASSVLYDRKDSAISRVEPGTIPWAKVLAGPKWFQVTGITAALSSSARATVLEALRAAKAAGLTVSIDPNYRAKLWSLEDAGRCMAECLVSCDVLVTNEADVEAMFGIAGEFKDLAARLVDRFGLATVVVTRRESPLVWRNAFTALGYHDGRVLTTRAYEVEIVDRLGAGDAFAAGLIHGLLDGDAQKALDWAAATAALKHSIPGDLPWVTRDEVEALLKGGGLRVSR
jgi:2-dehydro-3-deoxygluconokinase